MKGGPGGGGGHFECTVASKVGTSQLLAISSLALLACSIAHWAGSVEPTNGVVVCEGELCVPQGSSHWEEELR